MNEALAYDADPWREELIAGRWTAMALPAMNHIRVSGNIYNLFSNHLQGLTCEPISDGAAVYLTEEDCYIPDFMIVCNPERIRPDGVHGAPDLVAEVLSPSTARQDRGRKKRVYEACGVREYWLVDPRGKALEQYLLTDGHLELNGVYTLYSSIELENMTGEERASVRTEFRCCLYDDLVIRLEDVFRRVR